MTASLTNLAGTDNSFTTIFGDTASGVISNINGHTWTADSNHLYQTSSDLASEWKTDYATLLAGGSLNVIQHLEANAEAVFENTGLSKLSASQQAIDRMDVQREYDAMYQAMKNAGIDLYSPLTQKTYLLLENTMQSDSTLEELAMQGHGLNNSGISRYAGYTNDFQNNVDQKTLFIGGGLNNNQKAIADFFDDSVLSHTPYDVVSRNGVLTQLNQNAAAEDTLHQAIVALDDSMFYRTYTAADFSVKASSAHKTYVSQAEALLNAEQNAAVPAGEFRDLFGDFVPDQITTTAHVWTADANGLYHTGDLSAEWRNAYVDLVTTGGKDLTAEQRLEANAEAAFENTALSKLSTAIQQRDREDAQRQFDAEFAAMAIAGIDPNAPLSQHSYLLLEHTLRDTAMLEELAVQGHGLNSPPSARYNGYTNDFQNNVDTTTLFVGGGLNNGKNALTDFFDDNIMSHMAFATVVRNGKLIQLNQNGALENNLATAIKAANNSMHFKAYDADDFRHPTA